MRLVKNIGVGQNKPVHYAVFLDQMMQSPTNLMLLLTTWMIGERDVYHRHRRCTQCPIYTHIQQQKTHIDNTKTKHPNTANAPRPAPTPSREEEIHQLWASLGDNILKRRNIDATIESVLKCLKDPECIILCRMEGMGLLTSIKIDRSKRTAFLKRSKDIIAASSLAAARVSDSDVQSVIFGTMKAMAHKIGLKITDKQLAAVVPNVGSLKNWEFSLAGGSLAQMILLWSSKDKKGWSILHQFNLFDIDKGRHSMVEAANAIHLSLQSMHLDDIDVEYNYPTDNLGINTKVESLHWQLVKIGVMPEISGFMNCLLHAFNLATGLRESMNTVKKCNNLDHLKKYYSMKMTQLLDNEHYIAGSSLRNRRRMVRQKKRLWPHHVSCSQAPLHGEEMIEDGRILLDSRDQWMGLRQEDISIAAGSSWDLKSLLLNTQKNGVPKRLFPYSLLPVIVKWFIWWLFNHKSVVIPSTTIDLYHYAGDQAIKLNPQECIE
eukprot:scaffold13523_cov39-Cyclotella_meneghiniana.AAC.2